MMQLEEEHIADYQSVYKNVSLELEEIENDLPKVIMLIRLMKS